MHGVLERCVYFVLILCLPLVAAFVLLTLPLALLLRPAFAETPAA